MGGQVVVVGSLNMDLVVQVARHPRPGETVLGDDLRTFPGGKGANQAVAAARLGAPVVMVGRVGRDGYGQQLRAALAADRVDLRFVQDDPVAPSGVALISVDAAGQNAIIVAPGANARVGPEDIRAAEEVIAGAALLVAQLECPLPAVAEAVALAGHHGVPVVLNPAPARQLDAALLRGVRYLVPNQHELAGLTGATPDTAPEPLAQALCAAGVGHVIVTLGEAGALLVDGASTERFAARRVAVVDTTAAGDAFVGALSAALASGLPLREAVRQGIAAGSLAVTRAGAQPSLPTRAELDAALADGSLHP
ncbi:MAG: ribokinase [Chloroflexi bacterium OHK40]